MDANFLTKGFIATTKIVFPIIELFKYYSVLNKI